MNYASIIKEIGRGAKGARPIDPAHAEQLFGAILDGKVPDLELGAIIIALRVKSESLEEVLGFKRAMDARCAQVPVPVGPRLRCTRVMWQYLSRFSTRPTPSYALRAQRSGQATLSCRASSA